MNVANILVKYSLLPALDTSVHVTFLIVPKKTIPITKQSQGYTFLILQYALLWDLVLGSKFSH